ncbi:MAG: DNA topoisomerase I, partial [Anaeroplasmataceae bacterium]|nr:DNA topoisomerase I [Anaeroplasmataceae bacterium]
MQNIIIVESPSKSKTIGSYVGKGYLVLSSKGHICDLATSGKDGLGIDIEHDFKPNYKVMKDKEELVEYLKATCKGRQVYLATDPDREGEAIAYHLARTLDLSLEDLNRIEFNEITKPAVRKALENPHRIDMQMVNSQECRRMIDRILGFKLSKLLQRKIGSKSAGRVQSVVLKLIVDLEKEILAFVPTPYYEMEANFNTFKLKLVELDGNPIDNKNRILDRKILESLQPKLMSFFVSNISNKLVNRNRYPAFTTSTLQQDSANKLNFPPSKTM